MLLSNLDPPRLCNGTCLTVKYILPHVLEATILTGLGTNEDIFIPRIPLIPVDMPSEFKRLQFPVRLSFAITINKSQGQSLGEWDFTSDLLASLMANFMLVALELSQHETYLYS